MHTKMRTILLTLDIVNSQTMLLACYGISKDSRIVLNMITKIYELDVKRMIKTFSSLRKVILYTT